MNETLRKDLLETGFLHRPLPLHREKSLEAGFPGKTVLSSRILWDSETRFAEPTAEGTASLACQDDALQISAPLRADHWPEGAAPDGDYSNFGVARLTFRFPAQDWQGYNRLRFQVRGSIRGARIAHLNVAVENCGQIPIPDSYGREGATVFDLEPGSWTDCIWEFNAMPRDAIYCLTFYVFCSGHDISADSTLHYTFRNILLEQVSQPEHELGWENPAPGIRLSTEGYWGSGAKTAVTNPADGSFSLHRETDDQAVFSGTVRNETNPRGSFGVLDFSEFTQPGRYYLQMGTLKSSAFSIGDDIARDSLWRVLNFFFCERCGFPVPGKHGTCHQDIIGRHNGTAISFGGGWHDAGDVSQQAAQTGEVTLALFENAMRCRKDSMLYLRLMEEAQWGLDFLLKTRFGDGYRVTSAGATRITDNRIGNMDDVEARVHNHSYENFLFAGVEAYAAYALTGFDDALASNALQAAKEDFGFAKEVFAKTGVDPAHMYEHTYNSGLSQYYAVMVWAASCLYRQTNDPYYASEAREAADKLLACQETGTPGVPMKGFFYRDESHSVIVHFNHQSREHQFMQALDLLCRTQKEHPDLPRWEKAMQLYGDYLKQIITNTAPYGMLPAGIHKMDEHLNREVFPWLHVTCDYDTEKENYLHQLNAGTPLGDRFVLRNFPIWFSFRGNSACMLSAGKAAAILGRYFDDKALMQIAYEQMYWMWGKNPFGQSLIYGAGTNYCRQYAVLCGECVGEVPVGVETLGNEDVPYWPQNNNATFREVWVGSASRWLMLCADCLDEDGKGDFFHD